MPRTILLFFWVKRFCVGLSDLGLRCLWKRWWPSAHRLRQATGDRRQAPAAADENVPALRTHAALPAAARLPVDADARGR